MNNDTEKLINKIFEKLKISKFRKINLKKEELERFIYLLMKDV